ncbi:MAG TPA: gluconokinase [Rhodopila sp.]|uniref:gluconokinase n=1 Tax=Rhodopila sp. TaxID=2480087 RepID=UPI002D197659|nr:gluconokinase [Rhodopila sp.]HVY14282.1 gluconokinase [Rhodopila sp.]
MTMTVVMGVSGCGKTTIAAGIARATGWELLEGDAFHPTANIAKMKAGVPLTDEDRWPWLRAIAARAGELRVQGRSCVVACSALKKSYRDVLLGDRADTNLVYLRGSHALIAERLARRRNHFMPPGLLESQFATLEEPGPEEDPIIADIDATPEAITASVMASLGGRKKDSREIPP